MVVITFLGRRGSGKSTSVALYAYNYYKKGYEIYSNMDLAFPSTKFTWEFVEQWLQDNEMLENIDKKYIVVIDEVGQWVDSRKHQNVFNVLLASLINQSRKRNISCLFSSQRTDLIEKRVRDATDFTVYCEKKKIKGQDYFINKKCYIDEFGRERLVQRYGFFGYKVFKLFKTRQIITPRVLIDYLERKREKAENKRLKEEKQNARNN